jgi:hypothetical protein
MTIELGGAEYRLRPVQPPGSSTTVDIAEGIDGTVIVRHQRGTGIDEGSSETSK